MTEEPTVQQTLPNMDGADCRVQPSEDALTSAVSSCEPEAPAAGGLLRRWWVPVAGLLTAQSVSLIGSSIVQYAIVWYITLNLKTFSTVTLSVLFGFLPGFILSPIAGVWADRYNRVLISVCADAVVALATLVLIVAFMTGRAPVWLLLASLTIRGAGTAIQDPAVSALVPQITPTNKITRINGMLSTASSVAAVASPVIAGALMALMPVQYILSIDVITAVIAIATILSLVGVRRTRYVREKNAQDTIREIVLGLKYCREHRLISQILFIGALAGLSYAPFIALENLLIVQRFGDSPWYLTANEMAFGMAMLVGGVLLTLFKGLPRVQFTLGIGMAVTTIGSFGNVVSYNFPLYLAFTCLWGLMLPIINAPLLAMIQTFVHQQYTGRVMAILKMISNFTIPFGALVCLPLGQVLSISWILAIACVGMLIITFLILANPLFSGIRQDPDGTLVLTGLAQQVEQEDRERFER